MSGDRASAFTNYFRHLQLFHAQETFHAREIAFHAQELYRGHEMLADPADSPDDSLQRRLTRRLLAAFAADGWAVSSEVLVPGSTREHKVDVVARKGGITYVIEVQVARESRGNLLTSLAASGLLQARKHSLAVHGRPMVVVGAPRLSPASVRAVDEFLRDFGDGTPWGVVDETGLLELRGPDLQSVHSAVRATGRSASRVASSAVHGHADPFSDLGQWCTKVLLGHLLPETLRISLGDPSIDRPIRNVNELAKIAGVSVPTAWRTVSALKEDGLIVRLDPLELLRPELLMTRWRAATSRQSRDIRTRWLFSSDRDPIARLADAIHTAGTGRSSTPRLALGLFAAAEVLGHGFVRGVAPHLLHEDPNIHELERLGLTIAGPGEPVDVFVRRPRFPETVYRGVRTIHAVPVTDIFQIWLDVSDYPARGDEMASYLAREVFSRVLPAGEDALFLDEDSS